MEHVVVKTRDVHDKQESQSSADVAGLGLSTTPCADRPQRQDAEGIHERQGGSRATRAITNLSRSVIR